MLFSKQFERPERKLTILLFLLFSNQSIKPFYGLAQIKRKQSLYLKLLPTKCYYLNLFDDFLLQIFMRPRNIVKHCNTQQFIITTQCLPVYQYKLGSLLQHTSLLPKRKVSENRMKGNFSAISVAGPRDQFIFQEEKIRLPTKKTTPLPPFSSAPFLSAFLHSPSLFTPHSMMSWNLASQKRNMGFGSYCNVVSPANLKKIRLRSPSEKNHKTSL